MDIPYYYEVYNTWPHRHCHDEHHQATSQQIQTSKRTDICDAFGNLRYIVQLSSIIENNSLQFWTTVSQILSNDISAFLRIPEYGYEPKYTKAQNDFQTCVQRYSSLIDAEMKDFNDIDIYKEKIHYEVLHPDCCQFCKWSRLKDRHHRDCHCHDPFAKFECHNPKNQQVFNYDKAFPPFPNEDAHRYCRPQSAWTKLPWQQYQPEYDGDPRPGDQALNRIFPTVDPLGHCENFEKQEKKI